MLSRVLPQPCFFSPPADNEAKTKCNNSEKRLKFQTNTNNGQLDLLDSLVINFEVPLKKLDTSLIHFSTDSSFTPLTNYHFSTDSIQKKLTLQYNWKENTQYNLIIEKDFAQDTLGRELLKTDTLKFRTKKITDYGSIRIRFKNFDPSANPVLLFVQNDNVIKSFPLSGSN
jgi:hypothetical protein